MRVNTRTGAPVAIYNPDYEVTGSSAEEKALSFIVNNLDMLHLNHLMSTDDVDLDLYLQHASTTTVTSIWTTVRYRQIHQGIPVYGSDIAITFNTNNKVKMVVMNYEHEVQLNENIIESPKQTTDTIIDKTVAKYAGGQANKLQLYGTPEKVVLYQHDLNRTILAWKIQFVDENNYYEEKEVLYDDKTGDVALERSLTGDVKEREEMGRNEGNEILPTKKKKNLRTVVREEKNTNRAVQAFTDTKLINFILDLFTKIRGLFQNVVEFLLFDSFNSTDESEKFFAAYGNVFDPDPISTSGGSYGDSGLIDDSDQNNDVLNAQMSNVTLLNVTYINGTYSLDGPYASIVDVESPFTGTFEQNTSDFMFTRNQSGFEAVNCYYHIDAMMRYINEDLEISVMPTEYSGGVRFDPHAVNGEDNSNYKQGTQMLYFGDGGVDDGEDSDVIVHELGHGIHHWLTGSRDLNVNEGLSEGFSDYLANSYSRSKNLWTPDDEEYYWVFKWDGHNSYWPGRVTNRNRKYPRDLNGNIYDDGEIWSSCNMKIWDAIGREKSDKAHLIGLSATGSLSNQEDTANAIYAAAIDLGYPASNITAIKTIYDGCGYDIQDVV